MVNKIWPRHHTEYDMQYIVSWPMLVMFRLVVLNRIYFIESVNID